MGALKDEKTPDPRLHHEDGTHRSTARTANGQDVEWFDNHIRVHLELHENEREVRETEVAGWEWLTAAMRALPDGWKIFYRVVAIDARYNRHVIARFVKPNTDQILTVNLDPEKVGYPHSEAEPGAYVISDEGTDVTYLLHAGITKALGLGVDQLTRTSL